MFAYFSDALVRATNFFVLPIGALVTLFVALAIVRALPRS